MKIIAWVSLAVLGAGSLCCILSNYLLLWRQIRAKQGEKVPSLIPIAGGLLGFFALRVYFMLKSWPHPVWSWYVLLPLALDPGCYLVHSLVMPVVWKLRGYPDKGGNQS